MRLPRELLPIYGTTLADMLGYTLMIPLLPSVAEKYGASDFTVGTLLSIPAFCSVIAAPLWGKASDYAGRKRVILISQALTLGGYLLLAVSHSLFWIFMSRIISGIGAGNVGAAQSYIADVTKPEERDQAYAIFGVVFGSAFIIGPVASGFLQHNGVQFPFYAAAALEAFNIVFTALYLPWTTRQKREAISMRKSLRHAMQPHLRVVFIRQFLFIFAVVYFLADFALYLRHTLHYDVAHVAWLLAAAGVVGALVQAIAVAPLAHRLGDRAVGQIGFACGFAAYALIYWVKSLAWFLPVLILWAIGAALVEPTLMALLAKRAPKDERGALMGVSDSANSIALILAPAIGTAIVGENPRLIGILPAIATLAAYIVGRRPASQPVKNPRSYRDDSPSRVRR
jgi:MFS family permease